MNLPKPWNHTPRPRDSKRSLTQISITTELLSMSILKDTMKLLETILRLTKLIQICKQIKEPRKLWILLFKLILLSTQRAKLSLISLSIWLNQFQLLYLIRSVFQQMRNKSKRFSTMLLQQVNLKQERTIMWF